MKILSRIPDSVLSPLLKLTLMRLKSDLRASSAFVSNPYRKRQGLRALANCRGVRDYLDFTRQFMGGGSVQRPPEIEGAIALIGELQPRRLCEIGTDNSGTTLIFSRALPTFQTLIGIDLYIKNAVKLRAYAPAKRKIRLLRGSSYTDATVERAENALGGEKLDALFIDADHTYEGAKQDFLHYRHLVRDVGLILFHDIVPDRGTRFGEETYWWAGGVPLLWDRLKELYPAREFVSDVEQGGFGIGAIYYDSSVELSDDFIRSADDLSAYPAMERAVNC